MKKVLLAIIIMSLLMFGCSSPEPVLNETVEDISVDQATEEIISNQPEIEPETEVNVTQAQKVEAEDDESEEVESEETADAESDQDTESEDETTDEETKEDETESEDDATDEETEDEAEEDDDKSDSILKGQLTSKVSKLEKLEDLLAKPAFEIEQDPIEEMESELDLFKTIGYDSDQGDLDKDMEDKYFN